MNDEVDSVEIGKAALNIVKFPVTKQRLAAEVYGLCVNNKPAKDKFYLQIVNSYEKPAQGSELGWVRLWGYKRYHDYVIFVDSKGRLRSYALTNDMRTQSTYKEHLRIRETLNQLFV